MRKIFYLGLLPIFYLISLSTFANRVVVKGTVKFPNGVVVANYPVLVRTDTLPANNPCMVSKTVYTNNNGLYEAVLECTTDIKKVIIGSKACDQYFLVGKEVPTSLVVEYNFSICAPNACKPLFTWVRSTDNALIVLVNSTPSLAGAGDEIVKRIWSWGDGTASEGNLIETKHAYAAPGTYEVCLKILTRNGCENKYCMKVVAGQPANNECRPEFNWQRQTNNGLGINTNSKNSITLPGDSIVSRTWIWGDGTVTLGNLIETGHVFPGAGTYQVCLVTKTKYACEKRVCQTVVIEQFKCQAYFIITIDPISNTTIGRNVKLNSNVSAGTTATDAIVERNWSFGDGAVLNGNVVDPSHVYAQPGKYKICLRIKTAAGCVSEICKEVIIELPKRCEAGFSNQSEGLKGFVNSTLSHIGPGDSIISRNWYWGDGTQLNGNLAVASHEYKQPGQYEVCLVIKTKYGCEAKTCRLTTILDLKAKCLPYFNNETLPDKKIRFNSGGAVSQLAGDSIIKRNWNFGDGTTLTGNVINPLHEYKFGGTYTVCLTMVTRLGCESRWCKTIKVEGGVITEDAFIKLVSLYPNPAKNVLYPVVWSKNPNVKAELAVIDVYGQVKWAQTVTLPQGNSTWQIPVQTLLAGPYILRITTMYGVRRANFYKMN